jgi:PAS domain S-box-containing protein
MYERKVFNSIAEFKLLEELPDTKPLVLTDKFGKIIYFNQASNSLFGLKDGSTLLDLNCEPNLADLASTFIISQYSSLHFDIGLVNSDGIPSLDYYVDLERIFIEGDEYCLLIFTSAAERKIIEERMNNLHNAIDYGKVAVIVVNEGGLINYSSKEFELILGKNIEQIYGRNLVEVLKNFLSQEDLSLLKRALEKKSDWITTISNNSSDGNLWFKELKLNPISNLFNKNTNFIITVNDITHHVLKNRFIKKSEQKQKSIINNISDLLLIARTERNDLIFENANDNFFKTFSIKRESAIEQSLKSIIPFDLYEDIFEKIMELNLFQQNKVEFLHSRKNIGKEFSIKITYTDDNYDHIRLFIINFQDITEQVKNERRLREAYKKEIQVNKLKSAFLENMSHEIRTPSTAILGYANFLQEDIESGNYDSIIDIANCLKDGVNRLMHLIERIVELSMLESGEYTIDHNIVNISYLLKDCFLQNQSQAEKEKINFQIELDTRSIFLATDETKLKKVVNAIVDNAIKYNKPNGSVTIKSSLISDTLEIIVEDTGRGIDEKKIDAILQPFVQEEFEGHKRNYEGAGLGLTLASKLIKVLRGEIQIYSQKNIGTSVKIKFKLDIQSEE